MSDFAFIIGQLRDELERLSNRVSDLEKKVAENTAAEDVRDQGHAIRNMTMVLERVVNQVFPEQQKDDL